MVVSIRKKKILVFDYDGTIVDSLGMHFGVFGSISGKYGMRRIKSKRDFAAMFSENFYDAIIKGGIRRSSLPKFMKESRRILLKKNVRAFPGIRPMMKRLSSGSKIFVISSNLTDVIKRGLRSNNIACVEGVSGGDRNKSKVDKIRKIKKKFPSCSIFYIGDTTGDMKEGRKAGAITVAVTWGYHSKKSLEKEKPNFITRNVKELERILMK